MSTPDENQPGGYTPDDAPDVAQLEAMFAVPSRPEDVGEALAALDDANTLDQGVAEAADDDALTGEVIDAPASPEPEAPAPTRGRVIEHRDAERRAVLPDWLTSRDAFLASARWAAGYAGHVCAYHGVRLPLYALRLAGRAPIGAARISRSVYRWAADTSNTEVRRELLASTAGDPHTYLRVKREMRGTAFRRGGVAVLGLGGASAGTAAVAANADPIWQAATVAVALGVLGIVGRNREAKIAETATATAKVPPLTGDLIRDALLALRLGSVNQGVKQDAASIRFLSIVRDGAGFRADIDLPPGATAAEVVEKRSQLASGLRRPKGCVWPEGDPDVHEGRLVLYVADRSLSETKPAAWPLAVKGTANVFDPIPLGVDPRGRKVETTLMYVAGIIGSIPRMGKTFSLRLLLLTAALDPRVEIHAHDLRGGADLAPLAKVAHYYRSGDDPEDMAALLADVRAMQKEMMRRYKVIRTTLKGDPRCPEGKVTDALASDKSLGLHPILAAYDETQVMYEHPQYGKELRTLIEDLVRRGPAAGIMVWHATQRPDDKSIPKSVSSNAGLRLAFKVVDATVNNMILGPGMYGAGYSSTTFSRKDLGVAYLVGESDDPVIVRTYYVDGPGAETIADRARAIREAQGRLTGMAAGDAPADTDDSTILDHLMDVWPAEDAEWPNGKVWSEVLAERLATSKPALYEGWTGAQVNAAVKAHGIDTAQVKHRGKNRAGLVRDALVQELGALADLPADESGEG
ncbi:FtsK/SpoIIIE domain-containing protein [Promicromonospora sukumoe]|uniref:S-DNA-T family DNA segregation ATPase FtsK/SpoIIIE n=1 Tax=Promicromonospora sukumoe TaxID=88382 RepID=A0A7W3JAI8_9MICO|nr:cell division protein FtsK [Promicromonospora sukumoe]MBA8809303.1 S-DNA-T family DNA segregation ATPase FtsK/SpoIIIE [Promicromonospora sukumoe]